jgi:hypothetical protein
MWKPVVRDYGDLFTKEEFDEMVRDALIIPGLDGSENPAKYIDGVLHEYFYVINGGALGDGDFSDVTHVMWYNK